jgi:hypothetical protein
MELFIPSLLAIVVAAVIVMFLLPRLSPVVLGVLALVFLIGAAYHHYKFFGSEYQISTWQLPLVQYAPYVLISVLIIFMIFFIVNFIGTGNKEAAAPLQAMNESVNKVANAAATAVNTAVNNVRNAVNRPANNRPPNANRPPGNTRFSQI